MTLKKLVLFILICSPVVAIAQWPLPLLGYDTYTYAFPDQLFLTKVKYTTKGNWGALFNDLIFPVADEHVTIHNNYGDDLNYNTPGSSSIYFLRNKSGSIFSGNSNEAVRITGSSSEYGIDFETDADDNFILLANNVGNKWSPKSPANPLPGDSMQILLCKTGDQNDILWYKLYGGSNAEYAVSIQKAGDGNFLVLAQTQSGDGDVKNAFGGKDIWLFKIDTDGNMLWQKTFGSSKDEIPTHMEVLQDGSILISGSADQSEFAPSSYAGKNAFLLKLTSGGDAVWIKVFGGNGDDNIKSFAVTPDGFVSIGTSSSADGDYPVNDGKNDIYIIKHDESGAIVWKKHYGNINNEQAGDIVYTPCGDKIFASYANEFSGDKQYISNPPYPWFSQNAGVRLGLYNSNGAQFYHYEDEFEYYQFYSNYYFNENIYNTLAANDRGGFLAGGLKHMREGSEGTPDVRFKVFRSFHIEEYGVTLTEKNYDTSLCEGSSAYGNVFIRDTTYSDTLRNGCGVDTLISKYTVKVTSASDSIVTKDTTICYGQLFEGTPVNASFKEDDTLTIATVCGFKKMITIKNVNVPSLVSHFLGNDTIVCKEGTILKPGITGSSYLWQDGSTGASLPAYKSGLYWAQVTDNSGCTNRDTINVSITDLFLNTSRDTTIDAHKSVHLAPSTNGIINWEYSADLSCEICQQTVASPLTTTTFYLTSQKDGCTLTDYVRVNVNKENYFYMPNAFTPNGDGNNDVFKPVASGISAYLMQLYNRWGQLIFHTKDVGQGWNGQVHGMTQDRGAYIYMIRYKNSIGKEFILTGSFLLLR